MKHYYYLHTNGDLIHKPTIVVDSDPQYFDSDFVKAYWLVDDEDRFDAWHMIITALAKGASISRVQTLASLWGLTKDDLGNYLAYATNTGPVTNEMRYGVDLFIEKILGMDPVQYIDELITKGQESEG